MFSTWKQEKATAALVDAATDMSNKLAEARPHILDCHAASAEFWAASYLAAGQDLHALVDWKPTVLARFVASLATRIAAMRKARDYDSSDGLAVWLHTARAVTEPRIAPAVRDIWWQILAAGPNAASMADDLLTDAGLQKGAGLRAPKGFETDAPPHPSA